MKSARVTLAQTRRAWQILGAARDLRHDPAAQAVAVVDGLCGLFGGDNGFHLRMDDYRPGGRLEARGLHYGSVVDPVLDRWLTGRLGVEQTLNDDIMVVHSLARRSRTIVLTQDAIWPRVRPHDFPVFAQVLPLYRMRDNLVMLFRPGSGQDMWGYAVHRRDGRRPYSPGQQRLAALLTAEMRRVHDSGGLTPPPDPAAGLPPRAGEVLTRLLRGRHPKRVARELGMSVHTVRGHVKFLFERFGVNSVQELLAKILGRRGE